MNIKIPLNREMRDGRLSFDKRNKLLARMTDDVAELVLEDNRLQTLALSIAESRRRKGASRPCPHDRAARSFGPARPQGRGARFERGAAFGGARRIAASPGPSSRWCCRSPSSCSRMPPRSCSSREDKLVEPQLFDAFPKPMRKAHADAIRAHRLRNEIVATKVANRLVNRLGPGSGVRPDRGRGRVAPAGNRGVPRRRAAARPRQAVARRSRDASFPKASASSCSRSPPQASARTCPTSSARPEARPASVVLCKLLEPGVRKISAAATKLIRSEVRNEAAARRDQLIALGASEEIVRGLVRLYELDGVFAHRRAGCAQEDSTSSR